MHSEAKWWLLPVVALAVIAGGTGWWGYQQRASSQAMAAQVSVQYNHSFHSLIAHVESMKDEIQKAEVSGEQTGFQNHIRNVWRLSDLASSDVARLPINLMPMHQTQAFLAGVGRQTDGWLRTDTKRNDPDVTTRLNQMDSESVKVIDQLTKVARTSPTAKTWMGATAAPTTPTTDNQVVDGFRKLDKQISGYAESRHASGAVQTFSSTDTAVQKVTQAQAKQILSASVSGIDAADLNGRRAQSYGRAGMDADFPYES